MEIRDSKAKILPRYFVILNASVDGADIGKMVFRVGIDQARLNCLIKRREKYRKITSLVSLSKIYRWHYDKFKIKRMLEKTKRIEDMNDGRFGLWCFMGHYDEFTYNQKRRWGKIISIDDIPQWSHGIKPRMEFLACVSEINENLEDIARKYVYGIDNS